LIEAKRRASAAFVVRQCAGALAAKGRTVLDELTGGTAIADWRRYPDGEIYDPVTHAQYFYHRHASGAASGGMAEHGHFHLFLRAEGMPSGLAPVLWPELAVANAPAPPQSAPLKRGQRDEVSHLIAVAVDVNGNPIQLFTTNRWVTGETWYAADDVIRMLSRFQLPREEPSMLLNRWLEAVVRLFEPKIRGLLYARDEVVMGWRRRRRGNVFEDPRLEITSSLDIDLAAELADAERALTETARMPAHPRPRRLLPPMAEGWGV
jgi:hypothetical protein